MAGLLVASWIPWVFLGLLFLALAVWVWWRPPLAQYIAAVLLVLFLFQSFLLFSPGYRLYSEALVLLGFIPADITSPLHAYTWLTSMFTHGGLPHLIGNLYFLLAFGVALEERVGTKRFALVYFLTGLTATGMFLLFNLGSTIPAVGASGAIYGLMGAMVVLYPLVEVPVPLMFLVMRMPVWIVALLFTLITTLALMVGYTDGTAHEAHFGGLVAGLAIGLIFRLKPYEVSQHSSDPLERQAGDPIDVEHLAPLIRTRRAREILAKVEQSPERAVQDLWMNRLAPEMNCPECQAPLGWEKGRLISQCGWKARPEELEPGE